MNLFWYLGWWATALYVCGLVLVVVYLAADLSLAVGISGLVAEVVGGFAAVVFAVMLRRTAR